MRQALAAFVVGLIFGLGVAIGGMTNPGKVVDFFDRAGNWDPSLALVMAAGLVVYTVGFRLVTGRARPMLAERFQIPTASQIDARLTGGAIAFGIGWGISGFCPGPAIAALGLGGFSGGFLEGDVIAFVLAMVAGSALYGVIMRTRPQPPAAAAKG